MLELIVVGDGAVVFCFTESTSNAILPPAAVCQSGIGDWVTCDCAAGGCEVGDWDRSGTHIAPISAAANTTCKRSLSLFLTPAGWLPIVRSGFALRLEPMDQTLVR
jgi:hypothetical protein